MSTNAVHDTHETEKDRATHIPLSNPVLPRWAPYLVALLSLAVGVAVYMVAGGHLSALVIVAALTHTIALPAWSMVVESRRAAMDRFMTSLIWIAFVVALIPLVSLIYTVVDHGIGVINGQFLTYSMRNVVGEGGGIYHAIMGTVLVTLAAAVISVPIGLFAAIYLVEYGKGNRLSRTITILVDVMTGIPSIVAGLFAYALLVLFFGEGIRMGFGGAVALSILMIPIVVRSCEEMLKLVPDDLREASIALGVTKWLTIVKVVIPTALSGIITGVTLSIARVIGETAPLLIVAGFSTSLNTNLFSERMMTLPVFIYSSYTSPGVPPVYGQDRAWGAALVLIVIVMALNLLARAVGWLFAPKTNR